MFSGLTEIGNQRLKFRDVVVAGVCGAGLFVGKERGQKGAPEISGGISSPWLRNKPYMHRKRLHKTWP